MNENVEFISILDFFRRIIKNWKYMLMITVFVLFTGITIGYFHASRPIKDSEYRADLLDSISLNQEDYNNSVLNLEEGINKAKVYIKALRGLTYNGQPDVQEYLLEIENIEKLIEQLYKKEYNQMSNCWSYNEVILNFDKKNNVTEEKKQKIKNMEREILISETNLQILSAINIEVKDNSSLYQELLINTKNFGKYKANLLLINNSSVEDIINTKQEFEEHLYKVNAKLEQINFKINELAKTIAKEKIVLITTETTVNKNNAKQFNVKIVHSYKRDSFRSRFSAIIIFTFLVGISTGMFFAGVKKDK